MAGKKDQQMKEITERLEQGVKEMFTSEMYTKYLQTMSQFHNYSFNNTLLIAMQKPEATLVAGYQAWQKKFRRQVKRGEKGIQIIAPAPIREKETVEKVDPETKELVIGEDGQPETEEVIHVIPRFRVTSVFDVSQTYGEPLPELETPELMGSAENYEVFMQAVREVSPVPIRFDNFGGEAKGFYSNTDKEIVIREGMSGSQTMKTAIHEVTHAKLHDRDVMEELGDRKDKMTKEVEAESVAYTVCQYFGLDTSDYSFPYIAGWSSSREMKELRTSMDTVRKTAGEFIDSMTEVMQRLMREQPQQEHLQDTDFVLEYTFPSGEGFSYFVVRGMEKEELLVQLNSYHELYGESREKEIDTFLKEQGTEVIPWYDSSGLQVENPVSFYDVIYHGENGLAADAAEYPAVIQAALLMDRAEYREKFLSDADKLLITRYAEKAADMDKVNELIRDFEAAAQAPDSRVTDEVRRNAQAEIDAIDSRNEMAGSAGRELADHPEQYQRVELFDVPALFSNGRVDAESLPEGIFSYDLRGSDYDPGYPITVENHVTVNHAATVLTAVPLEMPEQGYLRLGEGLNFIGGEQTIMEYKQDMAGEDIALLREKTENAIGRANENLYLSGEEERYAIYQIAGGTKGREYQFMGMDFINSHNMTVDAADYRYIYGGRLTGQDTLDSLYERFNINHPADYTGHSLSMSDVVVLQRDGEAKAYFVDRIGFTELPDFIPQRLYEAEMNRRREDSQITLDTAGVEIEQHEGLWHTVDKREIQDEIFYLMKHNEYGDSVAAVIVNADGELVAQELENGFDRGAFEAIREYLAGKGIAWEPELPEESDVEKNYSPVYRETLTYAMGHAAADEYLDSRKRNIDCKRAVEAAIRENFDGLHLSGTVADAVLEEYGEERLSYVLACTVQHKQYDGRFSRDTKEWAAGIPVPENVDRGRDMNLDYVVESHPTVLDGFIGIAREKFKEREQALDAQKVSIARFYVVNDAYGVKAEREYQYFPVLGAALTAYAALPNHLDKQVGMESTDNPPSRMSLINCRNGIEELNDIKAVSLDGKWVNTQTEAALKRAKDFLKERDTEIAYQMGSQYFSIQTIPEGYDYTFYNADFSDIDGGILDQPGIPIRQAIDEIVEDFAGAAHPPLKVMDAAEFAERVEMVGKEETGRAQAAITTGEPKKELSLISDNVKPEKALNWKSRAEIEETVLCYAQAQIDGMGLTEEVKLLGARVYGSRTRTSLAKDGSDLDVVISYTGNIREDAFFNALHEGGLEIACLPIDMNPISLEKTGTLETFMENVETYLDGKEAEKLAADMVTFSYCHDTYNYLDAADDREGQIQSIAHDISEGNISGLEDWMQEVIRESRDPKEAIEAKEFLQKLIDRTDGQRFTVCETTDAYEEPFTVFDRVNGDYYHDQDGFTPLFLTEQEAEGRAAEINAAFRAERESQAEPEPKITFYVAECMEFPVLGEYHNNLTLQEAVDIYSQIPPERRNGIKGIGFRLEDGSMYDGEMELMSAGVIHKDVINEIPHYKESPLVQKAIGDLEIILEQEKERESRTETPRNGQGQVQETKTDPVSENAHQAAAKPEKPQKTAPETDENAAGGGRKQSVLQALRERQAKLKAQESRKPEKEEKARKKGEQEL